MWSEHSAQDFTTIFTGFQQQPVPHGEERHEAVFLDNSRSAVLQVKSTGKNNTSISEPLDNVSVVWNWPGLLARLKPHRGKCHLLCNHILPCIFSAFCLHAAHQLKQKADSFDTFCAWRNTEDELPSGNHFALGHELGLCSWKMNWRWMWEGFKYYLADILDLLLERNCSTFCQADTVWILICQTKAIISI